MQQTVSGYNLQQCPVLSCTPTVHISGVCVLVYKVQSACRGCLYGFLAYRAQWDWPDS